MAQDYASKNSRRKRATQQKPASGQRSGKTSGTAAARKGSHDKVVATPGTKKPILMLGAVLLVLGAMMIGLYRLAAVKPDPKATQAAVQATPMPSEQNRKEKVVAPRAPAENNPPKETYSFYTLLPESEVVPPKVEAYNSEPRASVDYSRYLLQVGSFRNQEDAERLRAELLLQGFPHVTANPSTSASGTTWYRVRVGPFPSRSKLNKAQDQLVRMNLRPMQVKIPQG